MRHKDYLRILFGPEIDNVIYFANRRPIKARIHPLQHEIRHHSRASSVTPQALVKRHAGNMGGDKRAVFARNRNHPLATLLVIVRGVNEQVAPLAHVFVRLPLNKAEDFAAYGLVLLTRAEARAQFIGREPVNEPFQTELLSVSAFTASGNADGQVKIGFHGKNVSEIYLPSRIIG